MSKQMRLLQAKGREPEASQRCEHSNIKTGKPPNRCVYKYNDVCRATADSSLAGQALTSPAIITPASAYNLVDTKYKNKFTKQRVSFAF